jgi:Family of unknown function (DUF6062)
VPELPVHSGADARLADAFDQPGCPLCRQRNGQERAYIDSILAEFVNDVGFRGRLDKARGFCPRHVHALLDADRRGSGGLLGPASLFHAVLRLRLRELAAAHDAGGRSRSKRLAEAGTPAACPICADVARADQVMAGGLVQLAADPGWAEAVASAPFCLQHVIALMAADPGTASWPAVAARQLARLSDLDDRLETFAHRSSHDRRDTITDEQRASVNAAASVLGGDEPGRDRT